MTMYCDILKLTSTDIHRHYCSLLSSELINVTYVLPELPSVHDSAFYLHDSDDVLVQSFFDCICIFFYFL